MADFAKPEMITWARERAGKKLEDLSRFRNLDSWEKGAESPSFSQLSDFAEAVHVPIGYLMMDTPPHETLPISDFRSYGGGASPSLEVRDAIDACILQQDWYKEKLREEGQTKSEFAGNFTLETDAADAATQFAPRLGLASERTQNKFGTTFKMHREKAEEAGVLVIASGVVLLNSRRALDPNEFLGFALADEYAPMVFVNSAIGSETRKIFTLAHELGHILLGESAMGELEFGESSLGHAEANAAEEKQRRIERWCNKFAAELLVPYAELRQRKQGPGIDPDELHSIAKYFNVSKQVILLRLFKNQMISNAEFNAAWQDEKAKEGAATKDKKKKSTEQDGEKSPGGPNYYKLVIPRFGRTFIEALFQSVADGNTLYSDAMQLIGIRNLDTFTELQRRIMQEK